ncbi:MAG: SDR family NAD(P)-dependent oxidoreductase [Pseudomonadota bacterium]
MSNPVAAILGAGPGNGLAFARKFAAEGYACALCARDGDRVAASAQDIPGARGYAYDVTQTTDATRVFAAIEADLGPVDTVIYNAGSGTWGNIDKVTPEDLLRNMDINAAGLMRAAQAVLPQFRKQGRGNLIVIGAGAATRGRPGTIAFAAGKAAQRSVAQSLGRQLGAESIHVAYVIIDGVIASDRTRGQMADKAEDDFLQPEAIADTVWALTRQDKSAWSFEIDIRPFAEAW